MHGQTHGQTNGQTHGQIFTQYSGISSHSKGARKQIIQFLNNLSYCTYVGIQYWEKNRAYVILLYIRRNSVLGKIVRM